MCWCTVIEDVRLYPDEGEQSMAMAAAFGVSRAVCIMVGYANERGEVVARVGGRRHDLDEEPGACAKCRGPGYRCRYSCSYGKPPPSAWDE